MHSFQFVKLPVWNRRYLSHGPRIFFGEVQFPSASFCATEQCVHLSKLSLEFCQLFNRPLVLLTSFVPTYAYLGNGEDKEQHRRNPDPILCALSRNPEQR